MKYTLNQLKIFHIVVKMKSISRAAEELNLTQPAVSIQIKKLQDQFEIPLIEIIGRKVFITDFGKSIAGVSQVLLDDINLINETVSNYKGVLTGKLSISLVSTAKYVMPYFLEGFMRKYPNVELDIDVTNKGKVVKSLENNECDFALVSVLPTTIHLNSIPLLENELHLVGSQKMSDTINSPEQLANQTLIFRENGSATRNAMEEYLSTNNVTGYKKMVLVSNEAVKQAVQAGLGYSLMPVIGLRDSIKLKRIKTLSLPGLPITTMWNLVYDKQKRLSPAAKALIEYLMEEKENIVKTNFNF